MNRLVLVDLWRDRRSTLTPIPNGYHESRYDNKLFWRLKRGIDGPISDDRKPTSVHDSEGGATSKILSGGFSKGPLGVLEFCYFCSYFFLPFSFNECRCRGFKILKLSHFFVLFCNFLRLWRFNFRLARKGEAIPNSILPPSPPSFPTASRDLANQSFYLHDYYTFGIFASHPYPFLPCSTSRCIHRCHPR